MNIRVKIIAGYLPVLFFMICIAFYAISSGKKYLVDAAGHHSVFIAEQMMKQILKELTSRVVYMESHIKDLGIINLLNQSNEHFSRYDAPIRVIDKIDRQWKKSLGQLTATQKALSQPSFFQLRITVLGSILPSITSYFKYFKDFTVSPIAKAVALVLPLLRKSLKHMGGRLAFAPPPVRDQPFSFPFQSP